MKIILISDITDTESQEIITGVRRYALAIYAFLKKNKQHQVQFYTTKTDYPFFTFLRRIFRKNINSLLTKMPLYYPFKKFPSDAIIHLTAQTFAIPLAWQKPKQPVIVTVHDIIPYVLNKYNSVWEKILYMFVIKGLKNATHIMTDSEHTKKDLIHFLKIPEEKISVVYLGVDRTVFFPESERKK